MSYKFIPRDYQIPILKKVLEWVENPTHMCIILRFPRRVGKDILCMYICSFLAYYKRLQIYYCLNKQSLAIDLLYTFIRNTNYQYKDIFFNIEGKISDSKGVVKFKNGSRLTLISALGNNLEKSIVGISPSILVLSEYSKYKNDKIYKDLKPALIERKALLLVPTTPESRNHFYTMCHVDSKGEEADNWFEFHETVETTNFISMSEKELKQEKRLCSEEYISTEYYAEFPKASEDSKYPYGSELYKYRDNKYSLITEFIDIRDVRELNIFISLDLGYTDETVIVFAFILNKKVYIEECYHKNNKTIDFYFLIIKGYIKNISKKYNIEVIIHSVYLPCDSTAKYISSEISVMDRFQESFKNVNIVNIGGVSVYEGILLVKSRIIRVFFNKDNYYVKILLERLNNYNKKEIRDYSNSENVMYGKPTHDINSHFADSFRYLMVGISQEFG